MIDQSDLYYESDGAQTPPRLRSSQNPLPLLNVCIALPYKASYTLACVRDCYVFVTLMYIVVSGTSLFLTVGLVDMGCGSAAQS